MPPAFAPDRPRAIADEQLVLEWRSLGGGDGAHAHGRGSFARVTGRRMAGCGRLAPGDPRHGRQQVQNCTACADFVTRRIRHSQAFGVRAPPAPIL